MKALIFIPGLFGSMGDDIIPGTGDWDFGLAAINYRPFIERLTSMGYKEGHDLFICFYDWRKSVKECTERYLVPKIHEVKAKCHQDKIDIIAHSMGGLLGRCYMQSTLYSYDIDKFIMIGTPNTGSVKAYYPWAGGTVPPDDSAVGIASHWLLKGYAWLFARILDAPSPLDAIHITLPSLQDMLPSIQHPPYLISDEPFNQKQFIPVERVYYRNHFLDELNRLSYNLFTRDIRISSIIGDTKPTMTHISVARSAVASAAPARVWPDGRPVRHYTSRHGDGTVLTASSGYIGGQQYVFPSYHSALPVEASHIISYILGISKPVEPVHASSITSYISIIADGPVSISLIHTDRGGSAQVHAMSNAKGQSWLFIPQPKLLPLSISIKGLDSGEYVLGIDTPGAPIDRIFEFRSFIKNAEVQNISIQITPFKRNPIIRRIR
jgi:pimeloyl-ACP methyl ester carboxylesterase